MVARPLVGGWAMGARVAAAGDLHAGEALICLAGTLGSVVGEYSACRLTVHFDARADGCECAINLLPAEIRSPNLES